MIAFENVTVRYAGAAQPALSDVTLSVEPGAFTGIGGPNGSGKSTLVRALLRIQPLASGSISVEGTPMDALTRGEVARRIAVLPQREEPAFAMRVREYVALGRYPHLGAWSAMSEADAAQVAAALTQTGTAFLAGRFTDQLSGGEWQLVRIARALAQNARALVLDEPTTFLDLAHEMQLFELLECIARAGHTVVVISHHLNLLSRFAGSLTLLSEGRVIASGFPHDVLREDVLERVYGWPVHVNGGSIVPRRRNSYENENALSHS